MSEIAEPKGKWELYIGRKNNNGTPKVTKSKMGPYRSLKKCKRVARDTKKLWASFGNGYFKMSFAYVVNPDGEKIDLYPPIQKHSH